MFYFRQTTTIAASYSGYIIIAESANPFAFQQEDVWAFILAHELAHGMLEHVILPMNFEELMQGHGGRPLVNKLHAHLREGGLQPCEIHWIETEADIMGLCIAAEAGFDPRNVYKMVGCLEGYRTALSLAPSRAIAIPDGCAPLDIHPSNNARLRRLNYIMPIALEIYEKSGAK